jgi:GNAT superfamily N-acetyltransferase
MTASSSGSASSRGPSAGAEVVERSYDHPDSVRLLTAFYGEQVDRYGAADPIDADADMYARPQGLFVVAYVNGSPAACGGYRTRQPGLIEIKKLYTAPAHRRQRLSLLVLSRLETDAASHGGHGAVLETGARNHAALELFKHVGYQPTSHYVAGRDPAINRPFFKDLRALNSPPNALRTSAR